MSNFSDGISTVFTPRATCVSWCTPAPCDSGATTSAASAGVSPGIRSHRWLVTTNAIWPWVSTDAFGRPVVPEVKKNQHGSSRSTGTSSGACPANSSTSASYDGPKSASPIATVKRVAQAAA